MLLGIWSEQCWPLLSVRAKTLTVYQSKYKNWIAPTFGQREIDTVTRRDVQAWILSMEAVKGKEALPILKTLYREALAYQIAENNPTLGIRKKPYSSPAREFLTWCELDLFDFGSYNNLFRFCGRGD